MIKWISVDTPPEKCDICEKYLVTVEYSGDGNTNGRKTMLMTYEEKGRKRIPTWCWDGRTTIWKVLYWAELPAPYQE